MLCIFLKKKKKKQLRVVCYTRISGHLKNFQPTDPVNQKESIKDNLPTLKNFCKLDNFCRFLLVLRYVLFLMQRVNSNPLLSGNPKRGI